MQLQLLIVLKLKYEYKTSLPRYPLDTPNTAMYTACQICQSHAILN